MPTLQTSVTSESDETDTAMTTFSSTSKEGPQTSIKDDVIKTSQKIKSVPQIDGNIISYYINKRREYNDSRFSVSIAEFVK